MSDDDCKHVSAVVKDKLPSTFMTSACAEKKKVNVVCCMTTARRDTSIENMFILLVSRDTQNFNP